jgi:hypothetical protein
MGSFTLSAANLAQRMKMERVKGRIIMKKVGIAI